MEVRTALMFARFISVMSCKGHAFLRHAVASVWIDLMPDHPAQADGMAVDEKLSIAQGDIVKSIWQWSGSTTPLSLS